MQSWDLKTVEAEPYQPQILASAEDARTIVLHLPAGEELQEHEVHERARIVVVDGEVEVTAAGGGTVSARAGHGQRAVRFPPAADPHPVAGRRPSRRDDPRPEGRGAPARRPAPTGLNRLLGVLVVLVLELVGVQHGPADPLHQLTGEVV